MMNANAKGFNEAALKLIEALGGDPNTGRCFCPVHDDGTKPSLHVGNGDKSPVVIHCFGGGRDHDREVIAYCRKKGIWPTSVTLSREQTSTNSEAKRSDEEKRKYAIGVWNRLRKSRGKEFAPLLKGYLGKRGINAVPKTAMMTLPIQYKDSQIVSHDAGMVLPIRNADGKLCGIHATWLNGKADGLREEEPPRQSYGQVKGNFVALSRIKYDKPPDDLIIGEGVETVLSAMQVTGFYGIATAGAWNKAIPPQCARYIVLADNDSAGQNGARDLARHLCQLFPASTIQIATPTKPEGAKSGYDWNDALLEEGVYEQDLAAQIENAPTCEVADAASDAARVDQLARLEILEYEKQYKEAAKQMGVRAQELDKLVRTRRAELVSKTRAFLQEIELWPSPVSGGQLLSELCESIKRHIVLLQGRHLAVALWILHAYAHDAARNSPILFITSPTKRCGKTQLLELLSKLVPKPLSAANITPATVFRAVEHWHPTLLCDEADTFLSDKSELRGILNSGHTRSQAYVIRCVGDELVPKQFSTWAPKAIAAIGRMHPTLEDRSIPIELRRKLAVEEVSRIPRADAPYTDLQRKCARWAKDNMEALTKAHPKMPPINDRARDNWEPLLAIAELCGGEWAEQARIVAAKISSVDDDETPGIQLLEDLRSLFASERCVETGFGLSSTQVVRSLTEMENRPWPEFVNGKPITARGVAKLLKPFKIFPRKIKQAAGWGPNGYSPAQFESAFKRYLAHSSEPSKTRKPK
jgi:putative DNA primase/helicase